MSATTKIQPEQLAGFFADFTKRFLKDGSPEAVDVEVVEPDWGEQVVTHGARLVGITFDHQTNALEFSLHSGDHRVYDPEEVWVLEEPDGFLSAIEIVHPDGGKDVVSIRRVGLSRPQ